MNRLALIGTFLPEVQPDQHVPKDLYPKGISKCIHSIIFNNSKGQSVEFVNIALSLCQSVKCILSEISVGKILRLNWKNHSLKFHQSSSARVCHLCNLPVWVLTDFQKTLEHYLQLQSMVLICPLWSFPLSTEGKRHHHWLKVELEMLKSRHTMPTDDLLTNFSLWPTGKGEVLWHKLHVSRLLLQLID